MMRKLICVILFPFFIFSCGKDPEISKSQENFHLKVFGGSASDSCNAIITDGRNLYLTGSMALSNGPDLFLVKTDLYGNEVGGSPKFFGTAGTEVGYDICTDISSNIIMAGYSRSSAATATNAFVVKTTPDGEELWSRSFGGNGDEKIYSVTASSGTIYAAGYTESALFEIKKRQGWILALSQNGDSIWSHDYGTNWATDELRGITPIKDSLLLTGTTQTLFGNHGNDIFLFILKKSTRGIENSVTLFRAGDDRGVASVYSSTGHIFVLGYSRAANGINNILLWKLREDLLVIREQVITAPLSETPSKILEHNGSIIIVGTAMNDQGNDNFLVYHLDQDLNVVSRNTYGSKGKGSQHGRSGAILDKSVIIGGATVSGSSSKASIFKTPAILP